jgi:hypothetical protein
MSELASDTRVPTFEWAGDIQLGDGSAPGNVVVGNWFRNTSDFRVSAGWGQGLVNVFDSGNSMIDSDWLRPPSEELDSMEASWGSATLALQPGDYGLRFTLLISNQDVGQERTAWLQVGDTVEIWPGQWPEVAPREVDGTDPERIRMAWDRDLEITPSSGSVELRSWFVNTGEQRVPMSWVQGVVSPMVVGNQAYTGQHFMTSSRDALDPGECAAMDVRLELQPDVYEVTFTLQVTFRELSRRKGILTFTEDEYGQTCRWEEEPIEYDL